MKKRCPETVDTTCHSEFSIGRTVLILMVNVTAIGTQNWLLLLFCIKYTYKAGPPPPDKYIFQMRKKIKEKNNYKLN